MGAIYGLVGEGNLTILKAMGERLSHRGAHAVEWSPDEGVFFGLRTSNEIETGDYGDIVAANAAIYNKEEVAGKHELPRRGASLERNMDFIASAFQALGTECFSLFDGDFVIAIWDKQDGRLILGRDPLGSRSLYYYQGATYLAFASEYKAFYALPDFKPEPDREVLQYLQGSKYLPIGRTLLREVCSLPAGQWMEVKDRRLLQHRHWEIAVNPQKISRAIAEEEIRRLFIESVKKRIYGVARLGAELSGGIDSSAVVAAMRQLRPKEAIKTYTIGSSPEDPEILVARRMSELFETEHYEAIADPADLLIELEPFVWHLEDPIGRTEGYLYYRLMRLAAGEIDTIFGGTASDGLFAGMPRHKIVRMMELAPLGRGLLEEFYYYTQYSLPPHSLAGKAVNRVYFGKAELPAPLVIGAPSLTRPEAFLEGRHGLLNHVLRSGVLYSVANSLSKAEKTHAAHGVEFRSPFTDTALVRYAFQLPANFKLHGLRMKEKFILRKALLPLLPAEIADRKKFPQRMDYDLKLSDILDELADRYLNLQLVNGRGFFKLGEIDALRKRARHQAYSSNRAMRLWTLITSEIWAQTFLDRRGEPVGYSD